jgi:hypothetical protein
LDGFFHLFRKTVLYDETDLPNPISLLHLDILNGGLLTEGRKGENQDQKEKNSSDDPWVLHAIFHKGYLRPLYSKFSPRWACLSPSHTSALSLPIDWQALGRGGRENFKYSWVELY